MARILIIEDNAPNLELMRYLLTAFGHTVLTTMDGAAALPLVHEQRPDLILCDLNLPGLDGFEIARALKADPATRAIPMVAVTALAMAGDRERTRAAGFDGYIAKPIEPDAFVPTVERHLAIADRGTRPAIARGDAQSVPARPAADVRVLVVDDAAANREFYHALLEPHGYRVTTCERVADALRNAAHECPDLVISDLHMPGGDGFTMLDAMRADPALARVPIVILSSSAWGRSDRERALQSGADRFLLRPIEPQALLDELASVLVCKADDR